MIWITERSGSAPRPDMANAASKSDPTGALAPGENAEGSDIGQVLTPSRRENSSRAAALGNDQPPCSNPFVDTRVDAITFRLHVRTGRPIDDPPPRRAAE